MKEKVIKNGKEIVNKKKKGVLHNVFIIDASQSMNFSSRVDGVMTSRYTIANQGINDEIAKLRKDDKGDVNVSVFEFDSVSTGTERITEHCFNTKLKDVEEISFRGARGNTPLYQAIEYVINKFLRLASKEDTVLIKIFTDGQHNCHWGITPAECKSLIKDAEDNREFIVTFIGTETDTESVITNLGISRGNTFKYDGSISETHSSMNFMSESTASLISARRSGAVLKSKSFYKQDEK